MNEILFPVLLVSGIGLFAGLLLAVLCINHDKGAIVKKECSAGCTGCPKCVKICPENAISMYNLVAKVDYDKCTGCGQCTDSCPNNAIKLLNI